MRSEGPVLNRKFTENKVLVFSLIVGIVMQVAVVSIPILAGMFKVCPLPFVGWIIVGVLAVMPLIVVETQKRIFA